MQKNIKVRKPRCLRTFSSFKSLYFQSSRPDSNRRPTHYECVALPTALRKHLHKTCSIQVFAHRYIKCFGLIIQSILWPHRESNPGLRRERASSWPLDHEAKIHGVYCKVHRGDKIRTCGLCVPNAALYQTEPRLDTFDSIIRIVSNVNKNFTYFQF